MKHRTLFLLFAGLLVFFIVVQFPLWILVANRHSNRFDLRSVLKAAVEQAGTPQELRLTLENSGKSRGRFSQLHMSREAGVRKHSSPAASLDIGHQCISQIGSTHLTVVIHALRVQSTISFPWHVLQLLSVAADRSSGASGPRCVDVVLITSISSDQWEEDLQNLEFADMLTAVGWDAMTLRTGGTCPTCTSIGLHVLFSHDTSGSVLRPLDAHRTTWRLIPKVVQLLEATWPSTSVDRSHRFAFFSPSIDIASIPWMELFRSTDGSSKSRGIEAFTIVSPDRDVVVSSGLSVSLTSNDVVLTLDYAGYNAKDVRHLVGGRHVFSAMPDAFATDVSLLKAHWPRAAILSVPWETLPPDASESPFCTPAQATFVHFMLSSAEVGVPARSNGIKVNVRDEGLCPWAAASEPMPRGGVPLSALYETVGKRSEARSLVSQLKANMSSHRRLSEVLVEWDTFCIPCFGFTNEVMQFLVPLESRLNIHAVNEPSCFCKGTPRAFQEALIRIADEKPFKAAWRAARSESDKPSNTTSESIKPLLIHVSHKDPGSFPSFPPSQRPDIVVGRAMYEFTKVPRPWASHKDQVDEIWVPCRFVKWVFEHAGFPPHKLLIVPEPIDVFQYDPAAVDSLVLPPVERLWNQASNIQEASLVGGPRRTSFLSVFKLEDRKGWGELVIAYMSAFHRNDTVSLYLITYIYGEQRNAEHVMSRIKTFVVGSGRHWDDVPHVHVIAEELSELEMMRMYRSVDAFVLATKGEGWGLPAIQAMSMALPTIVSNWSGVVDFASEENSYLIPVEVEEVPTASPYGWDSGKLWGRPNVEAISTAMNTIVSDPFAARARGANARRDIIAQFSGEAVAEIVVQRIAELERTFRSPQGDKVNDAIEKLLQDHHLIV
jgi:glycosyltransferase involved in cell wall biosynthesis